MYNKFDILRKMEFSEKEDTLNNVYVIDITCDANDGDYMYNTIILHEDDFEQDELFMLVLAYVIDHGSHISNDKTWLREYLINRDVLIFAGTYDAYCHSIDSVSIVFYDEDGVAFDVSLPNIANLFESEEEFLAYTTKLNEDEDE